MLVLAASAAPAAPLRIDLHTVIAMPMALFTIAQIHAATEAQAPEVLLDIDSPGGSVSSGLQIIAALKELQDSGARITCRVGPGAMAASMAALIFESKPCQVREMALSAQLLFHEPAVPMAEGGKEWEFRRLANSLADMNRRMATLIAWRLGMTADAYQDWIKDRDRWLDWAEAVRRHAVDRVVEG